MKKMSVIKKVIILVVVLSFLVGMVVIPSFAQPSSVSNNRGVGLVRTYDRMLYDIKFVPLFFNDSVYGTSGISSTYDLASGWLLDNVNVVGNDIGRFQLDDFRHRWRVVKEVDINDVATYASYTLTNLRSTTAISGGDSKLSTNFVGHSTGQGNQSVGRKALQSFHSPHFIANEATWIAKGPLDMGSICLIGFVLPEFIVDNYISHIDVNEMNIVNLNENMSISLVYNYEVGYVGEHGFLSWRPESKYVQYGDYSSSGSLSNAGTIDDILYSSSGPDFGLLNDGYYINNDYFHAVINNNLLQTTNSRYAVCKLDLYEGLSSREYTAHGETFGNGVLVRNVDIAINFEISDAMFNQWREEVASLQDLGAQYAFDEFEGVYKNTLYKDNLGYNRVPFSFVSFPGDYSSNTDNLRTSTFNFISSISKALGDHELVNLTSDPIEWLADTVSGILSINLFGPISIGDIMYIVLGVGLFFIILKIFAGG